MADPASPAVRTLLAARTAAWNDEDRAALMHLVTTLQPSARHLSDVLDWIEDIVARDGGAAAALLADPELVAVLRVSGAASERLKRWKGRLRRLRFPRLAAREAAFAASVRALALGPDVAIEPPVDFEGGAITIRIRAASAAGLAATLRRLDAALAGGEMASCFASIDDVADGDPAPSPAKRRDA